MSEVDGLITEIERRDQGWPTVWLREPVYAGARGWIGTLAAVAAVNVGAALGLVAGRVHGDRRLAVSACAAGLETALALAGVRLRVIGEHNLWAARPAVFVMNHQSGLDAMVLGTLPLLVMHGTGDSLVAVAGSRIVHDRARCADKTLNLYEGLYHEVLNEPEKDCVIGDLLDWLTERS
jgi:fermentation-respiration switch protein FrsA (DUF1100 family)